MAKSPAEINDISIDINNNPQPHSTLNTNAHCYASKMGSSGEGRDSSASNRRDGRFWEYDINQRVDQTSTDPVDANFRAASMSNQPDSVNDLRETTKDRTLEGQDRCCLGRILYDSSYICDYWGGRLKLIELFMCLIAGSMLPRNYEFYHTRFIFFKFVLWTSFTLVLVDLTLHLLGLFPKLWLWLRSADISMFLHGLGCFVCIVASSLVANVTDLSGDPDAAYIASGFGFCCGLMFALEAIFFCRDTKMSKWQGNTDMHANWN